MAFSPPALCMDDVVDKDFWRMVKRTKAFRHLSVFWRREDHNPMGNARSRWRNKVLDGCLRMPRSYAPKSHILSLGQLSFLTRRFVTCDEKSHHPILLHPDGWGCDLTEYLKAYL